MQKFVNFFRHPKMLSAQRKPMDPVVHALSTNVPLHCIFQHLTVTDLLSCRLVNRKWTKIAGNILKARSTFISNDRLHVLETSEGFDWNKPEEAVRLNLEFLSNRLLTNPNFPFLGFEIFDSLVCVWDDSEVRQDFARSHGYYFKRLILDTVSPEMVVTALGQWCKNIEELTVDYVDRESEKDCMETARAMINLKNQGISLPCLRRLVLPPIYGDKIVGLGRELGGFVLDVAPKILEIENFYPAVADAVIANGKVGAISNLVIRGGYTKYTEKLQKLAKSGLKLTSLVLDCSYEAENSLAPCISDVLKSSQDSLKRLKIHRFLQDPPTMPKLKELCIEDLPNDEESGAKPMFLTSNPINSYWPVLETVRLKLQDCYGPSVQSYFRSDDVFMTVKTLEILCPVAQDGLYALAKIFPNLSCVRVDWDRCIPRPGHQVRLWELWTIPLKIKELEIYNYIFSSDSFLDSFLTGFPTRTCDKLRKMPKLPADNPLDVFRVKPSVVQLKGLEKLTIFFTGDTSVELPEDGVPPPSPVFDWYALSLMPNLHTRFLHDSRAQNARRLAKALEPYASFVSVEHLSADEVRQLFQ